MRDIRVCFAKPAPKDQSNERANLAAALVAALGHLPDSIDEFFPRPLHSAYSEQDDHNARLVADLKSASTDASSVIDKCLSGLSWYDRLVEARQRVNGRQAVTNDLMLRINEAVGIISVGRPNLDGADEIDTDSSGWFQSLPSNVESLNQRVRQAHETSQRSIVAVLQYRQVLQAPPKVWRSQLPEKLAGCDFVDAVEQENDEMLTIARDAAEFARLVVQDFEVLPVTQRISRANVDLRSSFAALEREHHEAIEASAWRAGSLLERNQPNLNDLRKFESQIRDHISLPIVEFGSLLRKQGRRLPGLQTRLLMTERDLLAKRELLRTAADLLQRVIEQGEMVRTIESEANQLLQQIEEAQNGVDRIRIAPVTSGEGIKQLEEQMRLLCEGIVAWDSNLSLRIPFVSSHPSATPTQDPSSRQTPARATHPVTTNPLLAANISAALPPMTPPGSPQAQADVLEQARMDSMCSIDLVALDSRVRDAVNDRALRLVSAVSYCKSSLNDVLAQYRIRSTDATVCRPVTPPQVSAIAHDVFGPTASAQTVGKSPIFEGSTSNSGGGATPLARRPATPVMTLLRQSSTSTLGRSSGRSTSNPLASVSYYAPTEASRNRAVSETPSRSKLNRLNGSVFRRREPIDNGSSGSMTPVSCTPAPLPHPIHGSASRTMTTPRKQRSSRPSYPRGYIADPKSALDVAVGQVVNTLNVSTYWPKAIDPLIVTRSTSRSSQLGVTQGTIGRTSLDGTGSVQKVERSCVSAGYCAAGPSWSVLVEDGSSYPGEKAKHFEQAALTEPGSCSITLRTPSALINQ